MSITKYNWVHWSNVMSGVNFMKVFTRAYLLNWQKSRGSFGRFSNHDVILFNIAYKNNGICSSWSHAEKKKSLCGDWEGKHDIEPNKEKKKVYFSSFISFGDLNVNYIWYCDNVWFFKYFFCLEIYQNNICFLFLIIF